jgi:hypothetical protein
MNLRCVLCLASSLACVIASTPTTVTAGVVVGSGSTSLWGRATPYTSWDVRLDPLPGLIDPAEGTVRDFAFYNGRLYCTSIHELQNGGPWSYAPGAAGSLATPVQPLMPFPPGTPWRFVTNGTLAINTSGQGYGAFTGPEPVLVAAGRGPQGSSDIRGYTLTQSGNSYVVGPLFTFPTQNIRPRSLEYVAELDRFVAIEFDQFNLDRSFINFHPHDASGILPRDSSTTVNVPGLRSLTAVSATFASMLTGQPITSTSLLAIQKDDLGLSDPPRLYLLSLTGQIITQTNYVIPGWVDPQAIAIDEANGLLFTSDRNLGHIHVLHIPSPHASTIGAVAVIALSRRRRHRAGLGSNTCGA